MEPRAKPAKAKVATRPAVARQTRAGDHATVRGLEQRLAEALEQKAAMSEVAERDQPRRIRPAAVVRHGGRARGPAVRREQGVRLPAGRRRPAHGGGPRCIAGAHRIRRAQFDRARKAEWRRACRAHAGNGSHRRRSNRPGIHVRWRARGSDPDGAFGSDTQTLPAAGRRRDLPARGEAVHRRANHPDPGIRRPGSDRDRERPPAWRNCRRAIGISPSRSTKRRRPARSCASSAGPRPTCSRCSTRSRPTCCASATPGSAASTGSTASSFTSWRSRMSHRKPRRPFAACTRPRREEAAPRTAPS